MSGCMACRILSGSGGINEPRWLFNLETHRGLGVQVSTFPENWYSADEERATTQVGGVHSPIVWIVING
jgi:hypothetical protein